MERFFDAIPNDLDRNYEILYVISHARNCIRVSMLIGHRKCLDNHFYGIQIYLSSQWKVQYRLISRSNDIWEYGMLIAYVGWSVLGIDSSCRPNWRILWIQVYKMFPKEHHHSNQPIYLICRIITSDIRNLWENAIVSIRILYYSFVQHLHCKSQQQK